MGAAPLQVSLNDEHTTTWKIGTKQEKLELVADSEGPFAETDFHPLASRLAARIDEIEKEFTTTLVARDPRQSSHHSSASPRRVQPTRRSADRAGSARGYGQKCLTRPLAIGWGWHNG